MTYREARVYLDKVSKYGSVLGLDTIRSLLEELGDPQEELNILHIAGTNGKGSVLAYVSTILKEAGFRTGRYISPVVFSYLENIQVDGTAIEEETFAELITEVQKAIARMETQGKAHPTVFEIETAVAFLYFSKEKCDYVVLETGLGGKEDATNVISGAEAVIFSSIGRDHMGFLGNTIEEIAGEKAGIIKPGSLVISAAQESSVQEVLRTKAQEMKCPICFAEPAQAVSEEIHYKGQTFSYKQWKHLTISLTGTYQIANAITALEVIHTLREKKGLSISDEMIRQGLKRTVWQGRFTCISEHPLFFVDGAHNEAAAKQLRDSVESYFPEKKKIYIFGVFKDKEYEKIVRIMAPGAQKVYTVNLPDVHRTLPAQVLKEAVEQYVPAEASETVAEAVAHAWKEADENTVILAFGSLSYLGQVIREVKRLNGETPEEV